MAKVKMMASFEAWHSIDMFAFRFVVITPVCAEIQQIVNIWPWKFKDKVTTKTLLGSL